MIQQNYFISAFPHSRVLLHWAVAEYLALPEVAAVPGNVSRHRELPCLKLSVSACWWLRAAVKLQVWCGAAAWAWPQNRGWSWWGQCPGRTEERRQWLQLLGLSGGRRVLLGRERLGASVCLCSAEPLPAPCAALLLHHTAHIFLTSCHQLKEFLQSSRKKVWEIRARVVLICPCLLLLSWDRGRNGKKQQILPAAEPVCPLYCCFAHSSLAFCKINWLSRI